MYKLQSFVWIDCIQNFLCMYIIYQKSSSIHPSYKCKMLNIMINKTEKKICFIACTIIDKFYRIVQKIVSKLRLKSFKSCHKLSTKINFPNLQKHDKLQVYDALTNQQHSHFSSKILPNKAKCWPVYSTRGPLLARFPTSANSTSTQFQVFVCRTMIRTSHTKTHS